MGSSSECWAAASSSSARSRRRASGATRGRPRRPGPRARCEGSWEKARGPLPVREIAAPAEPLRWKIEAGCDLRYEFRADFTMGLDDLPAADGRGLRIAGGASGRADAEGGPRLVFRNAPMELGHDVEGQRNPPVKQGEGELAPVLLRTDGRSWTEDDGPAALWADYGSWPGLVLFFPTLPESSQVGSEARWKIPIYVRGASAAVEARRGTAGLPPDHQPVDATPRVQDADVRLARWIELGGARAAVLEVGWAEAFEENMAPEGSGLELRMQARGSFVGQVVVLASGRLLHAAIDGVRDLTTSASGEALQMRQRHRLWSEGRLVAACDGPTLTAFEAPRRSLEERGTATYQRFHAALHAGEQGAVEAALHPRLRAAHPDGAIYRLLREHLARHGAEALGFAELASGAESDGATARFTLITHVRLVTFSSATVETTVTVEAAGDEVLISGLRSVVASRADGDLLEVTPARLHSAPASEY